ncbi:MAG: hypothetical protein IKQ60_04405 [Candidatus Methanomethylophilaceae archaeon]|nr:hypothetical protein [Candidatus Methanomethylophilaceae archaeon]
MKAETTARTFYSVVVVIAVVILFAPLASALLNVSGNQWDVEISTKSEYDLTWMDAECLSSNLTEAIDGKTGCRILYGEYSDPLSRDSIANVSHKVMSSGATSARAVGPDGSTLTQEMITYRNAVAERTVMDIHVPDIITRVSSISLVIGYEGSGIMIPASSANACEGNVVHADFTIPYVLKYAALAYGCDEYVGIHINYESNMKFDIDVRTDLDSHGYSFTTSGKDKDVISGLPAYQSCAGSIGDYTSFTMKNGVMELDGRNAAPSTSIKNSLDKGSLAIASGSTAVILSDDTSSALVDLLKKLETMAGGFA